MKQRQFLPLICLMLAGAVLHAQVDVDKSIYLSGAQDSDRAVTNLAAPTADGDAANKKYVDDQIALHGGGGSGGHLPGELYGGGVVFFVYKDAGGTEHGLVTSLVDNSTSQFWSNVTVTAINTTSSWDGASNNAAIVGQSGHNNSAALVCKNYSGGSFTDWFLPAKDQLELLWNNRYGVRMTLAATVGADPLAAANYWSSSEYSNSAAWKQNFSTGVMDSSSNKSSNMRVRCIRVF